MLVTVTLVASQNQGVSTPLGRLNPGDLPLSQAVRPERLERMAADLAYLESLGLITFTVADDPATDDRLQLISRNGQSNSNAGGAGGAATGTEFQGEDMTFYVPLPVGSASALDVVVIPAGTFKGKQLRILDWFVNTTTLAASCSAQLFDTAGGAGALSAVIAMTSNGTVRHNTTTALGVMAKTKGLFLRRSTNSNGVGEAVIWARAEY